jgi:L-Ala-D/L-Glu epimerase
MIRLTAAVERFPIAGSFRIARGAKTEAVTVVVTLEDGQHEGRGECVPYARYGETVDSVLAAVADVTGPLTAAGFDRAALQQLMPAGAARNAVDCALWDMEAKQSGRPAWALAGLDSAPAPVATAFTLSIDSPDAMGRAATAAGRPILKLKLAGDGLDLERIQAVRSASPSARLIVDANEGLDLPGLARLAPACLELGVEMIEQPLPAGEDEALRGFTCPLPLGADESAHGLAGLPSLIGKYRVVNIKLDKTGGLTEALAMRAACQAAGLEIMVGCMVASSLAMAPALLLTGGARYVDLDGPLLLARDRQPGLRYQDSLVFPADAALWG